MRGFKGWALIGLTLALMAGVACAEVTGTVDYRRETGTLEVSCSGLTPGQDYSLMVIRSRGETVYSLNTDNLFLIDQLTADASGHVKAAVIGRPAPECTALVGGEFDGQTSPIRLGRYIPEKSLDLPEMITAIEEEAFMGCSFTHIYIGESVKTIGARAFKDCTALVMISIPDTVTEIAQDAFDGCGSLTILCSENSAAHQLALAKGISFRLQ